MDRDEVDVHKLKYAKKERGQYPAILTEQAWSVKDLLYRIKHQIFLAGQSPYPERQDSSIFHKKYVQGMTKILR